LSSTRSSFSASFVSIGCVFLLAILSSSSSAVHFAQQTQRPSNASVVILQGIVGTIVGEIESNGKYGGRTSAEFLETTTMTTTLHAGECR